jgi:hypothetical protein
MRNLLTATLSSLALAALMAGSASAAGMTSTSHSRQTTLNPALQDQLERDASGSASWLQQPPLGQIVSPSNDGLEQAQTSRADESSFAPGSSSRLHAAPAGQVVGQTSSTPDQAAQNYSRD